MGESKECKEIILDDGEVYMQTMTCAPFYWT